MGAVHAGPAAARFDDGDALGVLAAVAPLLLEQIERVRGRRGEQNQREQEPHSIPWSISQAVRGDCIGAGSRGARGFM